MARTFFDSDSLTESMDQMGQRNGLRHLGTFDNAGGVVFGENC